MTDKKISDKKVSDMKKKLLKKQHTHAGTTFNIGTPLENLKPSDSDIQFMEKLGIV